MSKYLRFAICIAYLAVVVGLHACEFTPKGDNLVIIEKKVPAINIDLNGANDTIPIYNVSLSFNYSPDLKGLSAITYNMYVNNENVNSNLGSGSGNISTLNFSPNKYPRGFYKLKIEIITNSGTGSLADKYGAEQAVFSREWVLKVDIDPPDAVNLLAVKPKNGSLAISWTPYTRLNFASYKIHAGIYGGNGQFQSRRIVATISDAAVTECYDSLYIGGDQYYLVEACTSYASAPSNTGHFSTEFPHFVSADPVGVDQAKLTWTKCQFPANLGYYRVGTSQYWYWQEFFIEHLEDTVLTVNNVPFGTPVKYTLYTANIQRKTDFNSGYVSFVELTSGSPIRPFTQASFSKATNSLYLEDKLQNNLHRLDGNSYQLTASRTLANGYQFKLSPGGVNTYLNYNQSIVQMDPVNLKDLKTYAYSDLSVTSSQISQFEISDNNVLVVHANGDNWSPTPAPVGIWDMNGPTLIFKDATQPEQRKLLYQLPYNCLSADGAYIMNDSLYHIVNHQLKAIGPRLEISDKGFPYYFFSEQRSDQIVKVAGTTITVLNCADWSIIRQFNTEGELYNVNIDPVSGYIGGVNLNAGKFNVYDTQTGTLVKRIPIAPEAYHNNILLNNTLFSSLGYYRPI